MCVLRIGGAELDIDAFLEVFPVEPATVHRRGDPHWSTQPLGPKKEMSSVTMEVSDADFSDLPAQIEDALFFLRKHEEALRVARVFSGVDYAVLDFGIWDRDAPAQFDVFPASLLGALGALGIDLEISRYRGAEGEFVEPDRTTH